MSKVLGVAVAVAACLLLVACTGIKRNSSQRHGGGYVGGGVYGCDRKIDLWG